MKRRGALRFSVALLAMVVLLLAGTISARGVESCRPVGWPSDRSDLAPDPSLVRGTLANGFRYAVLENNEPAGRVALLLRIDAGSLNEQENQRGVAHFLEHMLFNGTHHYPPGELVKFFQQVGMSFGGDTNAHTSYDETVYRLDLPEGSEKMLRQGLQIMADYGRGALLLEEEVERERGVILAEKNSRDSAGYRNMVAANAFKFAGTLLPEREVIGLLPVLQQADSATLRSYYDSWYRPQNMLLAVVGDVEPDNIVHLIEEIFSPLRGKGEQPPCPEVGAITREGLEVFYGPDPELGRATVSIESFRNAQPEDDSKALQTTELHRYAAAMILNTRLQKVQEEKAGLLTYSGYHGGALLNRFRYGSISAATGSTQWQEALATLTAVLEQALQYGVLEKEVERVQKDIRTSLESAVLTKAGRESESIGRAIVSHFAENRVFRSPEQDLAFYGPLVKQMGVAEVNVALRRDWASGSRIISVSGDVNIAGEDPEAAIKEAYQHAAANPLQPYDSGAVTVFPYLSPAGQAGVVKEERLESIDAHRLVLANNVTITLKQTTFEPNVVHLVVDVGNGRMSETALGQALVGAPVLQGSGTGRATPAELAEVLAGTTVNVRFVAGEESFRYTGQAVRRDAELLLQLVYHLLEDPGMREEAWRQARERLAQMYRGLENDIEGAIPLHLERFLAGGDPRMGLPPWEVVDGLGLGELRQWLLPQLATASVEVTIVGDCEVEEMKAQAQRYFGGLAKRTVLRPAPATLSFPEGQQRKVAVKTEVAKSLVVAAWPTSDYWEISRTRRLQILADIFKDRLRVAIREKLGASYAPTVFSRPSRVYDGYGLLQAQVVVAPGREEEILAEVTGIAEALGRGQISEEELARAKAPLLATLRDVVRTNDYWLYSVLAGSTRHQEQLDWPLTMAAEYGGITLGEIRALAAQYLRTANMASAVVSPEGDGDDGHKGDSADDPKGEVFRLEDSALGDTAKD